MQLEENLVQQGVQESHRFILRHLRYRVVNTLRINSVWTCEYAEKGIDIEERITFAQAVKPLGLSQNSFVGTWVLDPWTIQVMTAHKKPPEGDSIELP